jgi:hypothetical protein
MRSAARASIQRSCAVMIVARFNAHFKSEHNGQFYETPVIRLHATKGDSKTSSRRHCTCSFYPFSHRILDESSQGGNENPFTRLPHSDRYYKILEARKKLPVYEQMDEFYKLVSTGTPLFVGGL